MFGLIILMNILLPIDSMIPYIYNNNFYDQNPLYGIYNLNKAT